MLDSMRGRLVSVNVGTPVTRMWRGRPVTSAIWKYPVEGRIAVAGVNLQGDDQADRSVHGGPDKAVYAYDMADYAWWAEQLGVPLGPAGFGENLTVEGISASRAVIGEVWQVGSALLRVVQPRLPCFKLGMRMDDAGFVRRFADAGRPGAYLTIDGNGEVGAGDDITVVERPAHGVTVDTIALAYLHDHSLAERLLDVPGLMPMWRAWAERAVEAESA
jgi:MOSC domain-containing protein YiiM